MGRHKKIHCKICMRTMRGDKLKRHLQVHKKHKEDKYKSSSSEVSSTIESKECSTSAFHNDDKLIQIMKKENDDYKEKLKLGERVFNALQNYNFNQESVNSVYKEALDLFTKQKQSMDHRNVILRPWQEDLMEHIEIKTDRTVIWVVGRKGSEGKSWFQEFVASRFGWDRVVCGMGITGRKI